MTSSPEIILTEAQSIIENIALKLSGRPRHCGRNAFRLIRQAWLIRDLAPQMAAFATITAEEDAATALILALQKKKYPKAEKLNPRNHLDKTGVAHMIAVISKFLDDSNFPPMFFKFDPLSRVARIDIDIEITLNDSGQNIIVTPNEPLDILVSLDNEGNIAAHNFEEQLTQWASARNAENFLALIKREQNSRNELIYAADKGIPKVNNTEGVIHSRLSRVTTLMGLTIAILQAKAHQPLVTQVLNVYIDALEKCPKKKACEPQS